jgi:predicted nuclease with TOPRIM domain
MKTKIKTPAVIKGMQEEISKRIFENENLKNELKEVSKTVTMLTERITNERTLRNVLSRTLDLAADTVLHLQKRVTSMKSELSDADQLFKMKSADCNTLHSRLNALREQLMRARKWETGLAIVAIIELGTIGALLAYLIPKG